MNNDEIIETSDAGSDDKVIQIDEIAADDWVENLNFEEELNDF